MTESASPFIPNTSALAARIADMLRLNCDTSPSTCPFSFTPLSALCQALRCSLTLGLRTSKVIIGRSCRCGRPYRSRQLIISGPFICIISRVIALVLTASALSSSSASNSSALSLKAASRSHNRVRASNSPGTVGRASAGMLLSFSPNISQATAAMACLPATSSPHNCTMGIACASPRLGKKVRLDVPANGDHAAARRSASTRWEGTKSSTATSGVMMPARRSSRCDAPAR